MASRLFECALIVNEKRDAANNITEAAEIIREPFYILAATDDQARLLAGKELPDEIVNNAERFDRAVIIVRPF